jgi:hypothetical protein
MDSSNHPQNMLQPSNIMVLITFYMPLIISLIVLSWGIIMQSVNGFVYLLFMLGMSVVREWVLSSSGHTETSALKGMGGASICDTISYSKNGNNTYSVFMMSFTTVYLSMPMFINSSVNWLFIGACIVGIAMDIGVRAKAGCAMSGKGIFTNVVAGLVLAMSIVGIMTANGGEKFLFFNEIQSNKTVCSRPTKQQFKCTVYKNGEVLTNTTV